MKKQTAVEWLVEQIKSDQNQKALSPDEWMEVIEQAKAMEREQIIDAYDIGCNDGIKSMYDVYQVPSSVQYYNKTYKGGEQ